MVKSALTTVDNLRKFTVRSNETVVC